jgi:hypothetical protein
MFYQTWDEHIAREARHQARIEAAFDQADAWERLDDRREALKWLRKADRLSGGLPPAYAALRASWSQEAR